MSTHKGSESLRKVSDASLQRMAAIESGASKDLYTTVRKTIAELMATIFDTIIFHMRRERQKKTIEMQDVMYALHRHGLEMSQDDDCLKNKDCTSLIQSKVKRLMYQLRDEAVKREAHNHAQTYQVSPSVIEVPKIRESAMMALHVVYERMTVHMVRWAQIMRRHANRQRTNKNDANLARAIVLNQFFDRSKPRDVKRLSVNIETHDSRAPKHTIN